MVLFVKGMRGHAYAGAAARAGRGIDGKAVVLQNAQHAVLRGARLTAQRAAFQNLAHVIGKPRVMAALDAHGRKGRRIIGAPAEDDLRLLQRVQNWLHPHLRHHARGLRQRLWGQVGHIGTHLLNAALRHRLQNGFVWNVRPDHCGFGMPVHLRAQLADDGKRPLRMHARARTSRRTDHQRDVQLPRSLHQKRQILFGRHAAYDGDARAQLVRTCIRGTCVYHDGVRPFLHSQRKGFFRKAIPQNSARRANTGTHSCTSISRQSQNPHKFQKQSNHL